MRILKWNCLFPLLFNILVLNFNSFSYHSQGALLTVALKKNFATLMKFKSTSNEMLPLMSSKLLPLIVIDGLDLLIYGKNSCYNFSQDKIVLLCLWLEVQASSIFCLINTILSVKWSSLRISINLLNLQYICCLTVFSTSF